MRVPGLAALMALALACSACSSTPMPGAQTPIEVDSNLRTVRGNRVEARLTQTEGVVTLTSSGSCDLHRFRTLETTTIRTVERKSSGIGLGGAALIMASAGSLVGSPLVIGTAVAAPGGVQVPKVIGGSILGLLGVALTGLTIWVFVDSGRPTTETDVHHDDHDDGVVREGVPCEGTRSVPAHEPVVGRLPGAPAFEVPLGETDAQGRLEIDLAKALDPVVRKGVELPRTMPVYLHAALVGTVQLDFFERLRDDQAWARAAPEHCASGATSCESVAQYLRMFPDGRHAEEARLDLERGQAAEKPRREAERKAEAKRAADNARSEAAAEAAKRAAAAACRQICKTSCQGSAGCAETCVAQSCR